MNKVFSLESLRYILLLSFAVYLLGYIGSLPDPFASPIWPATGFQIAVYFLFGWRALLAMIPGIFIIQYQLGLQGGMDLIPATIFAIVSCSAMITEAVIAKHITRPKDGSIANQATYIRFAALGAPLGTLSSAVQGVSVLIYFDAYGAGIDWYVPYLVWWTGNLVSAYVLVPLMTLKISDLKKLLDSWHDFLVYSLFSVIMIASVSLTTNPHLQELMGLASILFLYFLIRLQHYPILVVCLAIGTLLFILLQVNHYTVVNVADDIFYLFILQGTIAVTLTMSMVIYHLLKTKTELAHEIGIDYEILQSKVLDRTNELESMVKQKEQAEKHLRRSNTILACIDALRGSFIKETNPFVMYGKFLDEFLNLTGSQYGLVGDIVYEEDGTPFIKMYAISNLAWNEPTRMLYEQLKHDGFEFRNLDNLIGSVIKSKAPVISNAPTLDKRSAGIPAGHPSIESFLGLPVFFGNRLVGIVGLANRPNGFDQELKEVIQPVIDALGQITVARQEREARDEAEEQIRRLAATDPLTGIANRRQYNNYLHKWVADSQRHQEPLSLLMMDIDHFKKINDDHGHDTGDKILAEFAKLADSLIRDADLLARWGGEEFAALLPHTDSDAAHRLGERIRTAVESHDFPEIHQVTVSIGIATLEPDEDGESLTERADKSLYQAKKMGRNQVVQISS
jgi:diguanylate cyclase (GGDEF)-like protein